MARLVIQVVIIAVALVVADRLLPGLTLTDSIGGLVVVSIVFGLINAFIRPVVSLLTCPINVLTLGLFTFVVNALMLMLTSWLTGGQVSTDGFWSALLGGIIVSVVSLVLNMVLSDNR